MEERKKITLPHKKDHNTDLGEGTQPADPMSSQRSTPPDSDTSKQPAVNRTRTGRPITGEGDAARATAVAPKRKQSILPSGMKRPEIVSSRSETTEDPSTTSDKSPTKVPSATTNSRETPLVVEHDGELDNLRARMEGSGTLSRGKQGQRWEDRYTRVTWYVQNTQLQLVRALVIHGRETSYTSLLNKALREYLKHHYGL